MLENTVFRATERRKDSTQIILQADHIHKNYGQLSVIQDVSVQIMAGEFVAITGPSGAGKSTLLHILGGLDLADRGTVVLSGQAFSSLSTKRQMQFRNEKIGFVFQFHHLLPEFTAIENVSMPLWIKGVGRHDAEQQAKDVMAQVGLEHRLHHKPGALSGGEQQRVAIARALINHPEIIFADEPTGNLDSETAVSIHQLFLTLKEQYHLTFVVVTHNEQLASIADRGLHMIDGKIVER